MPPTQLLSTPPSPTSPRSTANLRLLDSGVRISRILASTFLEPELPNFTHLRTPLPAWTYLIESPTTGRKMLFDLGVPRNWQAVLPPHLVRKIEAYGWDITFEDEKGGGVEERLREAGVQQLSDIDAVVWSHAHWDHIGDMSIFPASVELVVGPGFKERYIPGYPTNPACPVPESAWRGGRTVREVSAEELEGSGVRVGELRAVDFWGDGSVFLVGTPGHTREHLSAFVRTSVGGEEGEGDGFVFLGGDVCHHAGALRPSRYLRLPDGTEKGGVVSEAEGGCPGEVLERVQKSRGKSVEEPFFTPALAEDKAVAAETLFKAQEADGRENVLFLWAHAVEPLKFADLSPKYANDWKKKGWREKMLWDFLKDFEHVGKS